MFVLAGTPQQFDNFRQVFGDGFTMVEKPEDFGDAKRPILLLIGTWYQHVNRDAVMLAVQKKDGEGRARGQIFAKFGPPSGASR